MEGGDDVDVAPAFVPPPVKPHKAVYGLRFFFAIWVVFMHVGNFNDRIKRLRDISISMPGFFMLAGFMLSAATTRPIVDRAHFYKSRIIAAHPLYLLSVFLSLPIYYMVCIGKGEDRLGGSGFTHTCEQREMDRDDDGWGALRRVGREAYMLFSLVAAQTAWPWGVASSELFFVNPALWFSSAYYFTVFCFPFVHSWAKSPLFNPTADSTQRWCACSRSRLFGCNLYCCRPMLLSTLVITVGTKVGHWITKYALYYSGWHNTPNEAAWACWTFPPTWLGTFMLGVLTFNAFEFNRRGASESEYWPFWGVLTDSITLMLLLIIALTAVCYDADRVFAMFFGAHSYHGGAGLDQGWQLCLPVLAVWLYGLAAGTGITSLIMSNTYLVKYLSPAAYAIYLFHLPVCYYWWLSFYSWNDLGHVPQFLDDVSPWEFLAVLSITICLAVFVTHVANEYVTSMFMRLVDYCVRVLSLRYCKGESQWQETDEHNTLTVMVSLIKGLTGADVDGSTLIAECGFDSFGMGAMVALVRKNFPAAKVSAMRLYQLQTVSDLVAEIDGSGVETDTDASSDDYSSEE
ncbi:unnamed protein product [Prorocentrum cordatum]|uniref:Acyltransferase 3 domain-containing protein n=1 Tax=Prorocentrum cordatum TaxID=2364126 RepID=A0ABN9Y526_9DINO|nr:unnamed protein product [Polarella glacialis]